MFRNKFDALNKFGFQVAYDGDSGGNNGGGDASANLPDTVMKSFEKLLEKNGNNANAVAMLLFSENKGYRDEIRTLQGKVPQEGAIVLAGDDAAHWQTYRGLGAPDSIQTALRERDDFKGRVTQMERDAHLETVAKAAGYQPNVLKQIAGDLEYVIKDEQVAGKPVKRAFVKVGDKETPIDDWMEANKVEFMPSLRVEEASIIPGNGSRPKVAGASGSKPVPITPITDVRRNF